MSDVYYSPKAKRLIYLRESPTPEYWDAYWQAAGTAPTVRQSDYVVTVTKRYLGAGSRILEGGCGRADKVKALADAGFNAIGIDFAEGAVRQAGLDYPDLDIRVGDVRSLDFPDGYFQGCWSIGVIEHFWTGYDSILSEASRVLSGQGFLFLSAPWFSPYRQRKANTGGYTSVDFSDEPELFYQFALGRDEISSQLKRYGFKLLHWGGVASEVSMKQDMQSFKRSIDWLFASRGSIVKRGLRWAITEGLNSYCGHSFLAVAQRSATRAVS